MLEPRPVLALTRSKILLLVGLTLALIYSGVLFVPYGVGQDYLLVWGRDVGWLRELAGEGRVLDAALLKLISLGVHRIYQLRAVRMLGVLCMIGAAGLIHDSARRAGTACLGAAALALLVLTTPPFVVTVAESTQAPVLLAVVIALVAYRVADRSLIVAGGLVFIAAGIDPVGATLYLVPLAIDLLAARARWSRLLPFGGGLIVAHVLGRARLDPAPLAGIDAPLVEALHLHVVQPSVVVPLVAAGVIGLGLLARREGTTPQRAGQLAGAVGLLLLAYLPTLIAGDASGAYRTQLGLTSLLVVYAFVAARGLVPESARAAVAAVAVLVAGMLAVANLNLGITQPQVVEMRAMKSQLRMLPLDRTRSIVVAGAPRGALAPVHHDEMGVPTSSFVRAQAPMVRQLLREIHNYRVRLPITSDDVPVDPVGLFGVDMRRLSDYR